MDSTATRADIAGAVGDGVVQLAIFKVGNEKYGVYIQDVREVTRYYPITRVPKVPKFIEGVINLRGTIIPVVDMRKRFDLDGIVPTRKTRIIIISAEGKIVGLMVDEAREVTRIPKGEIMPPPKIIKGIESEYIQAVTKVGEDLVVILDFAKVLSTEERIRLDETEAVKVSRKKTRPAPKGPGKKR